MSDTDELDLSQSEAEAIARGLYVVARADGHVHEREAALISQFFAEATAHPSDLGALERAPAITGDELAAALAEPEVRYAFLQTALLLAYTDNDYGAGEAKVIGEFAAALGIEAAALDAMQNEAREYLVGQLAHLRNVEGVAEVARELKE